MVGRFIGDTNVGTLTRSYLRDRSAEFRELASRIALPRIKQDRARRSHSGRG
jgi:hypothetical protein